MDRAVWNTALAALVDTLPQFGIDIESTASTLHNDGVPYEIAYAANSKGAHARIVIDPYPETSAALQRERIHAILNHKKYADSVSDQTLDVIHSLGSGKECKRYWLALGIDGSNAFEIYSSLTGDMQNRQTQLDIICDKLKIPFFVPKAGIELGPVSISSDQSILTVYQRPLKSQALKDLVPSESVGFFKSFGDKEIAQRGLLIACKLSRDGIIGTKVDVCAHCVSPTLPETLSIGNTLGNIFLQRPFTLPELTSVSFWGVSWGPDWSKGQRLHVYLRPQSSLLKKYHLQENEKAEAVL